VPRLLTSLEAMWLLDLRERLDETRDRRKRGVRVKKVSKSYHKGLSRQARKVSDQNIATVNPPKMNATIL